VQASTLAGRLVSFLTSILGLLFMALITSSFMVKLSYTSEEVAASLMIEKARAESTLLSRKSRPRLYRAGGDSANTIRHIKITTKRKGRLGPNMPLDCIWRERRS